MFQMKSYEIGLIVSSSLRVSWARSSSMSRCIPFQSNSSYGVSFPGHKTRACWVPRTGVGVLWDVWSGLVWSVRVVCLRNTSNHFVNLLLPIVCFPCWYEPFSPLQYVSPNVSLPLPWSYGSFAFSSQGLTLYFLHYFCFYLQLSVSIIIMRCVELEVLEFKRGRYSKSCKVL